MQQGQLIKSPPPCAGKRRKYRGATMIDDVDDYIDDDFEDDFDPAYPKSCFGCYAPGTEECDWCEYADECA